MIAGIARLGELLTRKLVSVMESEAKIHDCHVGPYIMTLVITDG